jgi:hypothetical protein
MSKILKDGREMFDGEAVDIYEGRFTGGFMMDEVNGAALANDDLVTFMVTARVETPKFAHIKKTGDLKRSNTMRVEAVTPLDAEKARWMYDNLSVLVNGVNEGLIENAGSPVVVAQPTDGVSVQDDFFTGDDDEQV